MSSTLISFAMLLLLLLGAASATAAIVTESSDPCTPGRTDATTGLCVCANGCVLPKCQCWVRDCASGSSPTPLSACTCNKGWALDDAGSCTRYEGSTASGFTQASSAVPRLGDPTVADEDIRDDAEMTVRLLITAQTIACVALLWSILKR